MNALAATPTTDRAIILEAVREHLTACQIARLHALPIGYVRNIIADLRDAGLLPEEAEW